MNILQKKYYKKFGKWGAPLYICRAKKQNMSTAKTGIYQIVCLESNKKYIGQAVDMHKRWWKHRSQLRANEHCNRHIQNAWNLYGENNFVFRIIEECSIAELNDRELHWINHYEVLSSEKGYNMQSEPHIRQSVESRNMRKYVNHDKQVITIDIISGDIMEYESAILLVQEIGVNANRIRDVIHTWSGNTKGKSYTVRNLIVLYKAIFDFDKNYIEELVKTKAKNKAEGTRKNIETKAAKPRKVKEVRPKAILKRIGKEVKATNIETGEEKIYYSVSHMIRDLNMVESKVMLCLRGGAKSHHGYRIERTGREVEFRINPETKEIFLENPK